MKKRQKNSFGNNTSIVLIVTVLVVIVGCVIGYYLYKKNKNVTTTTKPVTKTTTKPGTKTTTKPVTKTTSKPNSPSSLQGQNCISLDPNSVTSSYDSTGKCIIQTCKSDYTLTNNTCQQKTCSVLDPNATSNIGYIINGNCIPQSCKHYYSVSGTFCQPEHCKPLDPLAADGTYNSSGVCEVTACSSQSFGVIENNSICVGEYTGQASFIIQQTLTPPTKQYTYKLPSSWWRFRFFQIGDLSGQDWDNYSSVYISDSAVYVTDDNGIRLNDPKYYDQTRNGYYPTNFGFAFATKTLTFTSAITTEVFNGKLTSIGATLFF